MSFTRCNDFFTTAGATYISIILIYVPNALMRVSCKWMAFIELFESFIRMCVCLDISQSVHPYLYPFLSRIKRRRSNLLSEATAMTLAILIVYSTSVSRFIPEKNTCSSLIYSLIIQMYTSWLNFNTNLKGKISANITNTKT